MAKPRKKITVGKEYGWLTVLGEAEKDRFGHIQHHVRCRCGREYDVQTGVLSNENPKCRECSYIYDSKRKRLSKVGDIINGWEIMEEIGKNAHGAILYRCRCPRCGQDSIRTRGDLTMRRGKNCASCQPNYKFCIKDGMATGRLPGGQEFLIDASLADEVSRYWWRVNTKGYIERSNHGMPKMLLHWMALGMDASHTDCIDHINRNRLDCRRDNLRIVTPQQNSMNRSMHKNNTSGYVGVCYVKSKKTYVAKIGINNLDITLGTSKDPIRCAQMYNCASKLLFREYAGHRNDVPEPSDELWQRMENKLLPFMAQAIIATAPCHQSLTA